MSTTSSCQLRNCRRSHAKHPWIFSQFSRRHQLPRPTAQGTCSERMPCISLRKGEHVAALVFKVEYQPSRRAPKAWKSLPEIGISSDAKSIPNKAASTPKQGSLPPCPYNHTNDNPHQSLPHKVPSSKQPSVSSGTIGRRLDALSTTDPCTKLHRTGTGGRSCVGSPSLLSANSSRCTR